MDPILIILVSAVVAVATAVTGFKIERLILIWTVLPLLLGLLHFFLITSNGADPETLNQESDELIASMVSMMPDLIIGDVLGLIGGVIASPVIRLLGKDE